jgi:hypothetical protein
MQSDVHDRAFDNYKVEADLTMYDKEVYVNAAPAECYYKIAVYPSQELKDIYRTSSPALYTVFVALVFVVMALSFFFFNRYIRLRNEKVMIAAARSRAIVSSIFPSNIRDRILGEDNIGLPKLAATSGLKDFLKIGTKEDETEDDFMYKAKPIADLFPEVRPFCFSCVHVY